MTVGACMTAVRGDSGRLMTVGAFTFITTVRGDQGHLMMVGASIIAVRGDSGHWVTGVVYNLNYLLPEVPVEVGERAAAAAARAIHDPHRGEHHRGEHHRDGTQS